MGPICGTPQMFTKFIINVIQSQLPLGEVGTSSAFTSSGSVTSCGSCGSCGSCASAKSLSTSPGRCSGTKASTGFSQRPGGQRRCKSTRLLRSRVGKDKKVKSSEQTMRTQIFMASHGCDVADAKSQVSFRDPVWVFASRVRLWQLNQFGVHHSLGRNPWIQRGGVETSQRSSPSDCKDPVSQRNVQLHQALNTIWVQERSCFILAVDWKWVSQQKLHWCDRVLLYILRQLYAQVFGAAMCEHIP